jgi:hypothetical protein
MECQGALGCMRRMGLKVVYHAPHASPGSRHPWISRHSFFSPLAHKHPSPLTPPHQTQAAYNPTLKDWYAAYNKPTAVKDWLDHNPKPKEQWILLLDSDMLLRHPFGPKDFNLTKGWAMAGHYDYMKVGDLVIWRRLPFDSDGSTSQ